ncbi:24877_t:CDS:1 [Cetraspora pellucida]|uniref:24877_t:CDS:1 n=1 Tax=Cetraspora pellucida TaxID=1433469 RepID=A0A9N9A925_9GLOM|nr:24877_t:CDS:1 [Cetraspora pellucida]
MKINPTIIQDQQSSILSDESIVSYMLIVSIKPNNNDMQLPVDIYKSNKLLLKSIIKGNAPFSFVNSKKFKEFVYSINIHYYMPAQKQLLNDILNNIYKKIQVSIQNFIYKSE